MDYVHAYVQMHEKEIECIYTLGYFLKVSPIFYWILLIIVLFAFRVAWKYNTGTEEHEGNAV